MRLWARCVLDALVGAVERPGDHPRRWTVLERRARSWALRHGLLSQWTEMLVVEDRPDSERTEGLPEVRVITVELPETWVYERVFGPLHEAVQYCLAVEATPDAVLSLRRPFWKVDLLQRASSHRVREFEHRRRLLDQQRASGAWVPPGVNVRSDAMVAATAPAVLFLVHGEDPHDNQVRVAVDRSVRFLMHNRDLWESGPPWLQRLVATAVVAAVDAVPALGFDPALASVFQFLHSLSTLPLTVNPSDPYALVQACVPANAAIHPTILSWPEELLSHKDVIMKDTTDAVKD